MKIEDFVQTARLEARDLNPVLHGANVRVPLKMGTGGWVASLMRSFLIEGQWN
jgi:hypothetical protein